MRKITLHKEWSTEYSEFPDTIEATITEELEEAIDEFQNKLHNEQDGLIRAVSLRDGGLDLLDYDDSVYDRLGFTGIEVSAYGWVFEVQAKYSSDSQAEYVERVEE